jgi:sortase A
MAMDYSDYLANWERCDVRIASRDKREVRKPTLLEATVFAAGVLLLAVYFQVRAGQESERQAGIETFYESLSATATAVLATAGTGLVLPSQSPDQTLWSENRIEAYTQSLSVGGGAPLAVLSIERLAIDVPVYDGAGEHNLNRGVGRVSGTASVDGAGNLGIAGHRDGFFRGLKDIRHGDLIQLRTTRNLVTYRVVSTEVVDPDHVEVLAPTDQRTLTLVTCFPFYFVGDAPQRFIVKAVAQQITAT